MADVIQLHNKPTQHQIRRAAEWAEKVLASSTRDDDRSLCQDIAHFICQIDSAAFLLGAIRPKAIAAGNAQPETPADEIFLRLYRGATQLLLKASDQYPETQALKPRNKRRPARAGTCA